MFVMNALTVISTDLLTPLGAYLRLRQGGRAQLPARVRRTGPAGTPLVRRLRLAPGLVRGGRGLRQPVVGYLGYEHAAQLEPTVPVPDEGRDLPESRFVVAEMLVRFDHALGMAEVLCGDPAAVAELLEGRSPRPSRASRPRAGSTRRLPSRHQYERARREGEGAHPRGRRLPGRALATGRAPDLGERAGALPLAAAGQPVAVPLPARARRPGARRVVARDARQGRGPPRLAEPDRRDDPPGRRRRRAAALLGEGPRRARDARRPRPQRPLARLPPGNGARGALPRAGRFSHVTHLVSEVVGELEPEVSTSTCCARASRPGRSRARRRCGRCS